jgi:transcriptional regulator
MYIPKHFEQIDTTLLHGLMAQHPLGAMVTQGADGMEANHIPFEIAPATAGAPHGMLRAHVARSNPVWRQAGDALVIFQGPSFYVSPSLYEDKPLHGKVVPTWNYAVVHAHGPLTAIEDPAWLLALLARLTDAHETRRETPWSVQDAPPDFIDKLLGAIVGIEIPVQRLEGKWKMSQNRSALDQRTIAAEQRGQ